MSSQHYLAVPRDPSTPLRSAQDDATTRSSFLHDLGILDHCDTAAFGHLAFHGNRLTAILSQLIVHWLVFADDQICFAVADYPNRATTFDALGPAGLPVFFADSVVIDVAHHIDHFAGHFFRGGCVTAMLVFLRDHHGRHRQ